jgi:beta-glucosidase/6-phospho-beta-glucosidase/beta-galactosidase
MPFGLVQVDFETQRRTLKSSARFFADVARSNGASLLTLPEPSLNVGSDT